MFAISNNFAVTLTISSKTVENVMFCASGLRNSVCVFGGSRVLDAVATCVFYRLSHNLLLVFCHGFSSAL